MRSWPSCAAALLTACLPATSPGVGVADPERAAVIDERLPSGFGSLRQEDITVSLVVDEVQVKVTPLDPAVIRLTAPDTWERLAAIRSRAEGADRTGQVMLISIQTEAPGGARFEPQDLEIIAQGTPYRATAIVALTAGWGAAHLAQRSPQQALYVFPPSVDPLQEMTIRMGDVRNTSWTERLPRLEAERARVRGRARTSARPGQPSSPNFLIFR